MQAAKLILFEEISQKQSFFYLTLHEWAYTVDISLAVLLS